MTSLPDWLVERAALDEVAPVSRDRVDRADPRELAERIAALRADNAAELAAYPAEVAVAQIEARVAAARRPRRRRHLALVGVMSTASLAVVALLVLRSDERSVTPSGETEEVTRAKGPARLLAFRQVGDHAEKLEPDFLVRAGDTIQLRYNGGGQRYGVIASVDGAGLVTLHYPAAEDAPTALATKPTALPNAYVLDDAPRFERFFFITADAPIDVPQSLAALRALAARTDSATAALELPAELRQWSLRLLKPTRPNKP